MPRGSRSGSDSGSGRYNVGTVRNSDPIDNWFGDVELVSDAVRAILANGDGILFSATSDGGAVAIKLYSDGAKQSVYAASRQELELALSTIRDSRID